MSKLFMHCTSLEGIGQLMMTPPNFPPKKSGIVINNYFNCEEGSTKCSCSKNIKGFSCYTDIRFYLK